MCARLRPWLRRSASGGGWRRPARPRTAWPDSVNTRSAAPVLEPPGHPRRARPRLPYRRAYATGLLWWNGPGNRRVRRWCGCVASTADDPPANTRIDVLDGDPRCGWAIAERAGPRISRRDLSQGPPRRPASRRIFLRVSNAFCCAAGPTERSSNDMMESSTTVDVNVLIRRDSKTGRTWLCGTWLTARTPLGV